MAGRGLQYLPMNDVPSKWDPVWFRDFVREVLALADVRNAIEGAGISIEGNSDTEATIGTGTDVDQLIDGPYVIAEPYSFLANARLLEGENGVVDIDDDGPGQGIEVGIREGGIKDSKIRPGKACSVIGRAADTAGFVADIQAAANDEVLRRTSDVVSFGETPFGSMPTQVTDSTFLTEADETTDYPNSRRLLAGSNITFDDTTPGELTINAGSGGNLSAVILADSPTAFWKLDEASGTLADSSGNGFDLTASGTINYQRSVLIPSLSSTKFAQFPSGANSARVTSSLGTSPPLTGDWTAEAVITPRVFGANEFRIFELRGAGETEAANEQASILVSNAGEFRVSWESGAGGTQVVTSGINLTEGIAHHLVVVKDGTANTITFFIDAIQVAEVSYGTEPTGGTGTLIAAIGENGEGDDTGDMLVGYVAFYNGIKLSAARVVAHAQAAGMF